MKRFFVLIFVVVLTGCSLKPSLKDDKLSDLQLNLEEFFDGQVIAFKISWATSAVGLL